MNTDASVIKDSAFYNFSGDNEIEVVFKLTNDYFQPSKNNKKFAWPRVILWDLLCLKVGMHPSLI